MREVFYIRDLFDVPFYVMYDVASFIIINIFRETRILYFLHTLYVAFHDRVNCFRYRNVINSYHVLEHEMRLSHSAISVSVLSSCFCLAD